MGIEPGSAWGEPTTRPADLPVAASDTEAARLVGEGTTTIGLSGGDLLATLGGVRPEAAGAHRFTLDLGWVNLDNGDRRPFVAHAVVRRRLWQGEFVVVMNAAWCGSLYLGPRAHPNDGLLDITQGSLPVGDRLEARRRARSGTHLPHPGLTVARRSAWRHELDRPTPLHLDGLASELVTVIDVELEEDAFEVVL